MIKIILVDKNDKKIGVGEKLAVHEQGLLHRAFSIFIFNSKGELLLQRRAKGKYHSGGLWSNSCCSHQRLNESLISAARKRLKEELGLNVRLKEAFQFQYRAKFSNGLIENELDHVFIGFSDKLPKLNPREADEYRYIKLSDLKKEIKAQPRRYSAWLKVIIRKYYNELMKNNKAVKVK